MTTRVWARLKRLAALASAVGVQACGADDPAHVTVTPPVAIPAVLPPMGAASTRPDAESVSASMLLANGAAGATAPGTIGSGSAVSEQQSAAGPIGAPPVMIDPDDPYLGLADPARGFRIATRGRMIAPDSDLELCEIGELPGTPDQELHIGAIETAGTHGSHHIVVSAVEPGSAADFRVRAHELGEQVPCIGAALEFGREGLTTLSSAQVPYVKAEYPRGVGLRVHGGQRVVFNHHYFNFSDAPIEAKIALAVHTLDPSQPITIATAFSFNNVTIDTPPGTERTFTATCNLKHDVMLSEIARHTHGHGTGFSVWFAGGARDGEPVWTSTDWQHDLSFRFDEPVLVKANEGLKYACSFRNDDASVPLRYGIRASDEMCILGGMIWSPEPGVELTQQECMISWIDEQGIGHAGGDAGGFPKATPQDALGCYAGSLGRSLIEACSRCVCDSCATIMANCNADAQCKALVDCTNACSGTLDCSEQCEPEFLAHSSGVGLLAQVGDCWSSQCGSTCLPASR